MSPVERLRWLAKVNGTTGLSGAAKGVAIALAYRADHAGECWPSVALLAADSGQAERSARRGLRELEGAGLLLVEIRSVGERADRMTSRYSLADGGTGLSGREAGAGGQGCPVVGGHGGTKQVATGGQNRSPRGDRAVRETSKENRASEQGVRSSWQHEDTGGQGCPVVPDGKREQVEALVFSSLGSALPAVVSEWAELYPLPWIRSALASAERAGKKRVEYVAGILRRYAREGGPDQEREPVAIAASAPDWSRPSAPVPEY